MDKLTFECKLLSQVVLISVSATEGYHKSLDYIPGAKFLGIVARKLYKTEVRDSGTLLNLFHSGSVRYGDAHPVIKGHVGFRVPSLWLQPKGAQLGEQIYIHGKTAPNQEGNRLKDGTLLKTVKGGYFTEQGHLASVNQKFTIKSAYDSKLRRAKDSQMYGYSGLEKGTLWRFEVEFDEPDYIEEVREALIGRHRIGRSKSAEYGLIEIREINTGTKTSKPVPPGETYLYAASNWCFYDKYGKCTTTPSVAQLGLPAGSEIDWRKSAIKTRLYRTWNQKRNNRNEDRLIIQRGSVIAVKLAKALDSTVWEKGIGAHLAEGFGKVLVNPELITLEPEKLPFTLVPARQDKIDHSLNAIVESGQQDDRILQYLENKQAETEFIYNTDKAVNQFIKAYLDKYDAVTSSQWGQVRNIAKNAVSGKVLEDLLFHPKVGFFYFGQSEVIWRAKGRRQTLKQHLFSDQAKIPADMTQDFLIKLANEMAKAVQNKVGR
jgi:hypothetical protein